MWKRGLISWVVVAIAVAVAMPVSAEEVTVDREEMEMVDVDEAVRAENEARRSRTIWGMGVLLGWSAVNMVTGAVGRARGEGPTRYFHEMNLGWNSVNAVIGGVGMAGALREDPMARDAGETMRASHDREKIFLVNVGLNAGYMAAGWALMERGERLDDDRLRGYGPSLVLQGAFLLAFDAAMFGIQRRATRRLEEELTVTPAVGITDESVRVGVRGRF